MTLPWFDAGRIADLVSMADAIDVLEARLAAGFEPADDPVRTIVGLRHGQLLLMPAEAAAHAGVKIATVAPDNSRRGRPRVQALYVLFDAETLTPAALLDGSALTSLRTPAISAVGVRHLAAPDASTLVVFGSGPQAAGHVAAVRCVREVEDVVIVGRDPHRARSLADRLDARVGSPADVAHADVVVCATSSALPVFDGALVRPSACVVAVGSHEMHARELDTGLMRRAHVVVEDRATALREAGDVVLAGLAAHDLMPIADVVGGRVHLDERPRVFKTVGMAWQDLTVAAAVVQRA